MDKNIYKKIYGKINYNTYENIQLATWLSGVGFSAVDSFFQNKNPIIDASLDILVYSCLIVAIKMRWSNGKNYTKDINQIRELYSEFIRNYNKLNKNFDLDNPIQVYSMFNYLLLQGYLSKDKCFDFSKNNLIDIDEICGANINMGNGVCRNTAAMLTDILNDYGIESGVLNVLHKDYNVIINYLEEPKYTKDELINWVKMNFDEEEEIYTELMETIDEEVNQNGENIEFYEELNNIKNPIKKIIGNHAISYAYKDGKSYFLDPTIFKIYRQNERDKKIIYDDDSENSIRIMSTKYLTYNKNYVLMKKRINEQYPTISIEEEKEMISNMLNLCKNNMDIFDQFYNENREIYDEISNKVLKIKKRSII